ncbi:NYN domain-containing protein [Streptomyces sp. PTM05]|uniref:NYN domain-containing protein n=1 Tax=Streptantibioticus parmotrematis TaxID=2873249 RepID=A0ABS7QSR9_9ACTN|nr:NYN domain-containing protein [Streptantibioticus parmotrematis]MBY8886236.1 NYN domain-containing protein [Streptantibioticus parmotrematis]
MDRPLPEGVRHRVVAFAADAFGSLTTAELPAQLRQYARFTPSRRAKFAANALAAALETDPVFRQRIAARLRETQGELTAALDAGTPPPAADPLDVAAAAYLLRPAGWPKLVAAAGEEAQRAHADQVGEETARELGRLRAELTQVRAAAHEEAQAARAELDTVRKESDSLHRKLRSATSDLRRGEAAVRKLQAELERVRAAHGTELAAAEGEARRLRARLAESESALEAGRRAVREGRSLEDMRLRLLLDTVLEAAQGLRRELALPPVTERPADAVEAVAPGTINPKDIARRALSEDDPALLDQLLALPQAHLVVDGYNVTKTGYPTMPLEKQRLRLLGGLAVLAAQSGAEVTCVFDGAELAAPVLLAPPRGVRVLFSKPGETADELIRRLVRAEPPGRPVVVVSADREVADGVARAGARPVASTLLLRRLSRG